MAWKAVGPASELVGTTQPAPKRFRALGPAEQFVDQKSLTAPPAASPAAPSVPSWGEVPQRRASRDPVTGAVSLAPSLPPQVAPAAPKPPSLLDGGLRLDAGTAYSGPRGETFTPTGHGLPSYDEATAGLADSLKKFGDDTAKWPVGESSRAYGFLRRMTDDQGAEPKPVSDWVVKNAPKFLLAEKPNEGEAIKVEEGWRKLSPKKAAELGILPGKPDQYSDKPDDGGWYPLGKMAAILEDDQARKQLAERAYDGFKGNAPGRIAAAATEGVLRGVGALARLPLELFDPAVADEMVRNRNAVSMRLSQGVGGIERQLQGAAGSLGQMFPTIAGWAATGGAISSPYVFAAAAGASAGNEAITEGRDAGLSGAKLGAFATGRALAEALPSMILSKLGAPGAEGMLQQTAGQAITATTKKELAGQLAKRLVKTVGLSALEEVPDELMTTAVNRGISAAAGIKQDQSLESEVFDTVVQSLLVGGLANLPKGTIDALGNAIKFTPVQPDQGPKDRGEKLAPVPTDEAGIRKWAADKPVEAGRLLGIAKAGNPISASMMIGTGLHRGQQDSRAALAKGLIDIEKKDAVAPITTEEFADLLSGGYSADQILGMQPGEARQKIKEIKPPTLRGKPTKSTVFEPGDMVMLKSGQYGILREAEDKRFFLVETNAGLVPIDRREIKAYRKLTPLPEQPVEPAPTPPPAPTLEGDPTPPGASIPVMITKDMRQQLMDRGFTRQQVREMTPEAAHAALQTQPQAPANAVPQEAPVPPAQPEAVASPQPETPVATSKPLDVNDGSAVARFDDAVMNAARAGDTESLKALAAQLPPGDVTDTGFGRSLSRMLNFTRVQRPDFEQMPTADGTPVWQWRNRANPPTPNTSETPNSSPPPAAEQPVDPFPVTVPAKQQPAKKDPFAKPKDSGFARMQDEFGGEYTEVQPRTDEHRQLIELAKKTKTKVTFFETDSNAGGYGIPGRVYINVNAPPGSAFWRLAAHELSHATGADKSLDISDDRARELADAYKARYPEGSNYRRELDSDPARAAREAQAELIGQFAQDKYFRDQLLSSDPSLWRTILDAVLKFFDGKKLTPEMQTALEVLRGERLAGSSKFVPEQFASMSTDELALTIAAISGEKPEAVTRKHSKDRAKLEDRLRVLWLGDRPMKIMRFDPVPPDPENNAQSVDPASPPQPGIAPDENPAQQSPEPPAASNAIPEAQPPESQPQSPQINSEPAGGRVDGSKTTIDAGGKQVPAQYAVVELATVIPSHDWSDGGSTSNIVRGIYPEGLQPREYTNQNAEGDKVRQYAREKKAAYFINTHPGADSGPPSMTQDGIVINGNGRAMTLQFTAGMGDFQWYRDALTAEASKFGIDPQSFAGMKNPALVRVVDMDAASPEAKQFAAAGNVTTTQVQSPLRTAASLSSAIGISDLQNEELLLPDDKEATFSKMVTGPSAAARELRTRIWSSLPAQMRSAYFVENPQHELTEAGKELVQGMLLVKVVPLPIAERMGESMKQLGNTIETATLPLLQLKQVIPGGDITPQLAEAIQFRINHPEIKTQKDLDDFDAQPALFEGGKDSLSPIGRVMLQWLWRDEGSSRKFSDSLRKAYDEAYNSTIASPLFAGDGPDKTFAQILSDAIGLPIPKDAMFGPQKKRYSLKAVGRAPLSADVLRKEFPGAKVSRHPLDQSAWRVKLPNGLPVDVRQTDWIDIDWRAIEREEGRKYSKAERDQIQAAGAFTVTLPSGIQTNPLAMIELSRDLAGDGTLRHEAWHLASEIGIVAPEERAALVDAYSSRDKSRVQQDEDIAEAREAWSGKTGLTAKIVNWIRDFLRKFGFGKLKADDVFRLMQRPDFWSRHPQRMLEGTAYSRAYHGTPHEVDRFSTSKIGTGEGAQAYGWGLYFAGKKQVAEYYRDKLSPRHDGWKDLRERVEGEYGWDWPDDNEFARSKDGFTEEQWRVVESLRNDSWLGFDYPYQAVKAAFTQADNFDLSQETKDAIDALKQKTRGRLYEVDLKPSEDEYLLWDKPLSEQSEKVKKAAREVVKQLIDSGLFHKNQVEQLSGDPNGRYVYQALSGRLAGDQKASEHLKSFGIRGVKYEDAGSRYAPAGAMKYRARWSSDGTKPEVYDVATNKAIDRQFSSFSEADKWIATQENDADRSYNYVLFDDADVEITQRYSLRKNTPEYVSKLANPGEQQAARDMIDELRLARPDRDARPSEEVTAAASQRLDANYEGEKARIIQLGDEGGQLSDVERVMARRILNDAFISPDDPAGIKEFTRILQAYDNTASEWGYAGLQLRDLKETPAQRRARMLGEAVTKPSPSMQKRMDDERSEARKERRRPQLEKLYEEHAQDVLKTLQTLRDEFGIEPKHFLRVSQDAEATIQGIRAVQAIRSELSDKVFEYWINSILSGIPTHVRNITGTLLNGGLYFTGLKVLEASLNTISRRPTGAQFGEIGHAYAGMLRSFGKAAKNFMTAWRMEIDAFENSVGATTGKLPTIRPVHIKGTKGRIVRSPTRLLSAVDSFMQTIVAHGVAAERAYRQAKAEGKKGPALSARMDALLLNPESVAWREAVDKANELAFRQDGGDLNRTVKRALETVRKYPGGRYIIPFKNTMVNIFGTGLSLTPLGVFSTIAKIRRGKTKHITEDLARNLASVAFMALLFAQDEDDPWITGSDGYGDTGQFRYSIKLGGAWYYYGWLEPFATAGGYMVDVMRGFKRGNIATAAAEVVKSTAEQIGDKTFAGQLGDLFKMISRPEQAPEIASQIAANFVVSWIPNATRSTMREWDDTVPNRRVTGRDAVEYATSLGKRILQNAELGLQDYVLGLEDYPRFTIFGDPIKRSESPVPGTDFLWRLLSPVGRQVDEPFSGMKFLAAWKNRHPEDVDALLYPARPTYSVNGQSRQMDDAQTARFHRLSGQIAKQLISRGNYDADNPTEKQWNSFRKDFEDARSKAKELLVKQWESGVTKELNPIAIANSMATKKKMDSLEGMLRPLPSPTAGGVDYGRRLEKAREAQSTAREIFSRMKGPSREQAKSNGV